MSAPDPDGLGAEQAMRGALADASLQPEQIAYLNLHGTGTGLNDSMESSAIARVFPVSPPCSSTKSLVGHTLGAAGAMEAGFCWLALQRSAGAELELIPHAYDGQQDPELGRIRLVGPRMRAPRGPVTLLVTCDEEVGSPTSRPLIERLAREARAALVLEPCVPGGALKVRRKGVSGYRVRVLGRAAHAGIEPDAGASALHELARWTLRALATEDREAGTRINVGVASGGSRSNVVAAEATAEVDVRFWTREEAESRRLAQDPASVGAPGRVPAGTRASRPTGRPTARAGRRAR